MTDWEEIDALELAWAREHREARETLADVCSATRRDFEEWQDALRIGKAPEPTSEALDRRVAIISDAVFEGWSIKEIARRARCPRAFVVQVGATLSWLSGGHP